MSLLPLLLVVFALSGLLMAGLTLAYFQPWGVRLRIHRGGGRRPEGRALYGRVFGNMAFSFVLVLALVYGGYPLLIREAPSSLGVGLVQALAILLLYDLLYYALHRFAFHGWKPLRDVHVVHHRVRHPHAVDSLYLHPVETSLGLVLLMTCTAVVGPVGVWTFAFVFAMHSFLNIIVHAGLDCPIPGLRALSFLARKHDIHHTSMKGGNYASLTPIFDILFGTAE